MPGHAWYRTDMSTATQLPPGVAPLEEFASRVVDLPWNLETVRCTRVDLALSGSPTVEVQLDRLPVGPSDSATWRLVVSMKYHRLRKYQFGSERLEDVSCLLADGKVADRLEVFEERSAVRRSASFARLAMPVSGAPQGPVV